MTLILVSKDNFIFCYEVEQIKFDPYRNKIRYLLSPEILKKMHMSYLIKNNEDKLIEVTENVEKYKSITINGKELVIKSLLKRFIFNYQRNIGIIKMFKGKATILEKMVAPFYICKE